MLLGYDGNVYAWGSNCKGQLGLGYFICIYIYIYIRDYNDRHKPSIIEGLPSHQVTSISTGGDINLAATGNGDLYIWPSEQANGENVSIPQRIPFVNQVEL